MGAVDRDLLEGLDQLAGALEVGDELVGGVLVAGDEFLELRAPQPRRRGSRSREFAAPREARRDREADADRVVDLVRDAGDEAAESGELLGLDQALLRLAQLASAFRRVPWRPQLALGLALGDGVVAEHLDGARHLADLVARVGVGDGLAVVARPRSRASLPSARAAAA